MPKQLYKVSVTTLEKFRRYMADTSSYDTEQALIETLEGKFEGSDKTRTGSAFHKIIESPESVEPIMHNAKPFMVVTTEEKGQVLRIGFPLTCGEKALNYRRAHPLMVCELPVKKVYSLRRYRLLVTGRVDGLEGVHLRDAKTKYSSPSDISPYTESCQWQFYCDILGLKVFHYDIFEVKRFKDLGQPAGGIHFLDNIDIVAHEPITCVAYMTMNEHLHYLMERFMDYIEFRNLFHLLKTVSDEPAAQETTSHAV